MNVLLPSTVAVLRTVRPCSPIFPNVIAAELFTAAHTRGELAVLPTVAGDYIVFDRTATNGRGVRARCPTLEQAHASLERLSSEGRLLPATGLSPAEASAGPAILTPSNRTSTRTKSSRPTERTHSP